MNKTENIFTITNETKANNIILLKHSYWKPFCLKNFWILLIIILPLSGFIIGWIYRNDCPMEKYISIWEIINGLLTISFLLLMCITKQIDNSHPNWMIFIFDQLKILFIFILFTWFIFGNIWVYKYYKTVKYSKLFDTTKKSFYCNKILYLHAFWYMTVIYILFSICLIYLFFSLIYNCIKKRREEK